MDGITYRFPEEMGDAEIQKVLNGLKEENEKPTMNDIASLNTGTSEPVDTESDPADMQSILASAANTVGIPPQFALAIAAAESDLKPGAKNKKSSASGLYQFISSTWNEQVKKHGDKHGVMPGDVLDPTSNALMGAEFTKSNIDKLTKLLERPPTLEETYLAHFSGFGGARKVLRQIKNNPKVSAEAVWGKEAAEANPALFTEGATATDVVKKLTRRVTRAAKRFPEQKLPSLREELGVGEFSPDPSTGMQPIPGTLFADEKGNLVIVDAQGKRTNLNTNL
jgi:hypothetical protein